MLSATYLQAADGIKFPFAIANAPSCGLYRLDNLCGVDSMHGKLGFRERVELPLINIYTILVVLQSISCIACYRRTVYRRIYAESLESIYGRNIYWSRPSVCLSVPRRIPTLLHGPGCKLEKW